MTFMGLYQQIDIALDTFPYAGTTTTCESILMGVPVVTLHSPEDQAGAGWGSCVHAWNVGSGINSAMGLTELIAHSKSSYLQIAQTLAGDDDRLGELRGTLRQRFLACSLGDADTSYVCDVDEMFRNMWITYCKTHP